MLNFLKKILGLGTKTIDKKVCKELSCHIDKTVKLTPRQKIIKLDTVYHHILKKLGYEGSFGEILKKNPKEIKNINDIWELHKLRNTLVHELRDMDERYLQKMSKKYEELCKKFLSQVVKK